MIKVTLKELLDSGEALTKISKFKLPAKLNWDFSRVLVKFHKENELFSRTQAKIFQEWGNDDPNPTIKKEYIPQYQDEMKMLWDAEIELNINSIKFSEVRQWDEKNIKKKEGDKEVEIEKGTEFDCEILARLHWLIVE